MAKDSSTEIFIRNKDQILQPTKFAPGEEEIPTESEIKIDDEDIPMEKEYSQEIVNEATRVAMAINGEGKKGKGRFIGESILPPAGRMIHFKIGYSTIGISTDQIHSIFAAPKLDGVNQKLKMFSNLILTNGITITCPGEELLHVILRVKGSLEVQTMVDDITKELDGQIYTWNYEEPED